MSILVYVEMRDGTVRPVTREVLGEAKRLAATLGGPVTAVACATGDAGLAALGEAGADAVLLARHDAFARHDAAGHAVAVAEAARSTGAKVVLFGASSTGKDLAPRVAAKLGVPLASDVTALTVKSDAITVTHPGYTGKILQTMTLTASPAVVSVRPGAYLPVANAKAGAVESLAPAGDPASARVRVTETAAGNAAKLDLGEAPVIISGGRGLKEAANFALVESLAAAFGNAAVGATRAVTDDGWRPHADQIGQTGRLVSPDLYVACGISGAIQHLAGMRTSKCIVAINKDKDAPIFKAADYGIVGDVLEILPVLTDAVKQAKAAG